MCCVKVISRVEPLDATRRGNSLPGMKLLGILLLLSAGLGSPEALAQNSATNPPPARAAGRAGADPNESQVVEE